MANLSPKFGLQVCRMLGSTSAYVEQAVEGSSVTYKAGAPVVFSSGKLVECTSPVTTAAHPTIGISMAAGLNVTTSPNVLYAPAYDNMVFQGYLQASSGGNSVDTHTLAQTDIGTTVNIAKDGVSGLWFLDFTNTTNGGALIIGAIDAIGTTKQALVMFKFQRASTSYN